ncbi:MAG: hypothetical protein WEB03_05675 [Nitriliruptor sp.]|uniref:hypothetical protein n=1 Tax=Nitriliruptor sp. TaxID=2448056 RepID=UPI0034A0153D
MSLTVTPREDHRTNVRRFDAVFGGPIWWGTHLGGTYWLVPRACEWGTTWPMHTLTIAMLLLCGRAWLSGVQVLRGAQLADPEADRTAQRDVFIGWAGILLSILFGAVVLYEGVPGLILDACAMTPTS